MSKPLIVIGDRTDHGGVVISADYTFDINGKSVARVNDMTVCPKCKGQFPITGGADDLIEMGQVAARDGDKTACGATLISSQRSTLWKAKSSTGAQAKAEAAASAYELVTASALVAQVAPTICLECLQKAAASGAAFVVRS